MMKTYKRIVLTVIIFFALCNYNYCQEELKIWNEFIFLLKNREMTIEKIRPLEDLGDKFKPVLLSFLDSIRILASPKELESVPEIIKTGNRIQFIIPLTIRTQKVNLCFSFMTDGSKWYFQHIESIFIRLDKLTSFPVSQFPDVSDQQKSWAREEIYWSFILLNIYLPVANEKGKEYALNLLKDGGGYFVGAKTWVPFSPFHKAFILYLCWEQANLRGNKVTLEKLTDDEAIIQLNCQFFELYIRTGHIKQVISLDDYKQIFETIWKDRAVNAGWNLDIRYLPDSHVEFHFTRTLK